MTRIGKESPVYSKDMGDNCPMDILNKQKKNILSLHLCNNGKIRIQCALGIYSNHRQCRSITKLAPFLKDKASSYALVRMYLSSYYYKKNKIRKTLGSVDIYFHLFDCIYKRRLGFGLLRRSYFGYDRDMPNNSLYFKGGINRMFGYYIMLFSNRRITP